MTAPLILSASAMQAWLSCGYKYFLGSVLRLPGIPSIAAVIGISVHAAAEEALRNGPRGATTALQATLTNELTRIPPPIEDVASVRSDASAMLALYLSDVAPKMHATMIEQPFVATVNGIGFSGWIDAADEDTDDLSDLKTTAGKTINGRKPSWDIATHTLQLTGYALGYESLTGRRPKRLLIDLLTRKPAYRRYEVQPNIADFLDTLSVVAHNIGKGNFEPTGAETNQCPNCEYRTICRYAKVS